MIVGITVPDLSLRAGGPTRTVVRLADGLAGILGVNVRLASQSLRGANILLPRQAEVVCWIGYASQPVSLHLGLPGRKSLHSMIAHERPHILHSNGIWHPFSRWCAWASRRHSIPFVVQPRGMLEPWALDWHPMRKRLALALYQRSNLESATLLVATAAQEAENLRRFGLRQPIAVIPNGVDLQGGPSIGGTMAHRNDTVRKALFLSRVHPKKGLKNLLKAWANVQPQGWLLQIAGPDEGGHLGNVLALAKQLGVSEQVEYLGEFDDAAKWAIYRAADLFVLPTFSENFGVVVAEAMSQGLPVITTTGTPWADLRTYDCGWWVEPSEAGLREALTEAFALPAGRLEEMGERGRNYVQRYDWSMIASRMVDVYRWVLGHGAKPDSVRLD